ncbi:hypothetical protein BN961_01420 [Afipia felis]|uniref:Uncharacterized protein n=1 Tax=Afipia felis TaxID=1035 RepID=A0A090MP13_AFIFE|nr:hypothetical protein BN961_01420 [Afipia felis]
MVGDRLARHIFRLPGFVAEQAPIAADGALELALPGLVIGLDQVDAEFLRFRQSENLRHHECLIGKRGERAVAHAAGAWPAGFADQDFLVGKRHRHAFANLVDMARRVFRAHRKIFPVRQDVNGDEIDRIINLAVAQPEFPHVRVGDRHVFNAGFNVANRRNQIGCGHLAAQQHLVADHQRLDRSGITLRQRHGGVDLQAVPETVAAEPDALNDLQPDFRRLARHLVEAAVHRIGADAIGDLGELGKILRDLLNRHVQRRIERALRATERRVGHAFQLLRGIERRARARHRLAEPDPCPGNHAKREDQKR